MSAALQAAAAELIAARQAVIDAQLKHHHAQVAANAAEDALIDELDSGVGEDFGTAVVCNGYALILTEEYWEKNHGDKIEMHRLLGGAS